MTRFSHNSIRNGLLRRLPAATFDEISGSLEMADLPAKHVLVEADVPTEFVCFMESGLASVVAESSDGEAVEVGHIGREGMTGGHLTLMTNRTPNRTFMQVAGSGLLLPVGVFNVLLEENPELRRLFLRYAHSTQLQLAHSALANARYSMHSRLARWLLMCHDRMDDNHLPLTHEFLSLMLGVRRSGVTDELHVLEGVKVIRSTRGNVEIIDRQKLATIAGGSYGLPEREYDRLLGPAEEPRGTASLRR